MPYFKSLPENAGPPSVFKQYPEIYRPFSEMSQAMMNGESPLSRGERELILAFAAGSMGCNFVVTGHSEVAYQLGIERGLIESLLQDFDKAMVSDKLRPLLAYVKKLAAAPNEVGQSDVDAVFEAGWDDHALQDAIAITGRAAFMHRLIAGHGFNPLDPAVAKKHAIKRVEHGYVNLYAAFRDSKA